MKYAYDKGFKKAVVNMPFCGWLCKLTHKPLELLVNLMKVPKGVKVRNFSIKGYQGESINVKEIVPEQPLDGAILVLHGGGFGYKAAPSHLLHACHYAEKLCCRAYLPDYHLLPDYPFPAAYEDAMATYRYIVSHADKLSVCPEKIIVLGDSAGGALAANVCNTVWEKGLPIPCSQVLIYPAIDNAMRTPSMMQFMDTPMWNAKKNKKMWSMYLKNATKAERNVAVPMKNTLPEILPPTYIETTEFDCLRDEGIAYAKHIQSVAKWVTLNQTKKTLHGYDTLLKHPITEENVAKRIEFMRQCLRDVQ